MGWDDTIIRFYDRTSRMSGKMAERLNAADCKSVPSGSLVQIQLFSWFWNWLSWSSWYYGGVVVWWCGFVVLTLVG